MRSDEGRRVLSPALAHCDAYGFPLPGILYDPAAGDHDTTSGRNDGAAPEANPDTVADFGERASPMQQDLSGKLYGLGVLRGAQVERDA
ncbi:hypothetical protein, partial [Streptomyces prunicolor]|uniref:hypothetical protein n=1 Tax=Streptomyces prunicolor TaxID=67348 RepID=UPI0033E08BF1